MITHWGVCLLQIFFNNVTILLQTNMQSPIRDALIPFPWPCVPINTKTLIWEAMGFLNYIFQSND
jgi:hypothetical protein